MGLCRLQTIMSRASRRPKNVKVVYFKMAGRAGAVRAALKLARIKYENDFVDRDSMQELKPRLPFGQVPVFEVNGEIVAQSNAFLRYVGKFSGLYPDDPFDALKVDEIVDGVSDSMLLLRPSLLEKNPDKKLRMRKELISSDGSLRVFLQNMERLVQRNQDKSGAIGRGHACGKELTIADISLFTILKMIHDEFFEGIPRTLLTNFPLLKNIHDNLNGLDVWGL